LGPRVRGAAEHGVQVVRGLPTEAPLGAQSRAFTGVAHVVLGAFGADRVMFGEDGSPPDPRTGETCDQGRAGVVVAGWPQVPATVRPVPVIVRCILG
jgi:hypothetical protein